LENEVWLTVAAAVGAVVVGPLWYVWLALILWKWGRSRSCPDAD
jgi:hypothetical protein